MSETLCVKCPYCKTIPVGRTSCRSYCMISEGNVSNGTKLGVRPWLKRPHPNCPLGPRPKGMPHSRYYGIARHELAKHTSIAKIAEKIREEGKKYDTNQQSHIDSNQLSTTVLSGESIGGANCDRDEGWIFNNSLGRSKHTDAMS